MDVLWTVGEDPGADLVGLLGSLDAAAYACVCSWKALAAGGAGLMALLYLLNYYLRVARRPQVVCGGKEYHAVLRKHCPALFQRYWPTIWAHHAHACTVLRPLLQRPPSPPVCYKREVFEFEDGGQAALDWALSPLIPERSPVMLILTGVVGSSSDSYVKHLVNDGLSQGYRPVVFNNRGCGGLPLKTNKTYCASNTEDLAAVVNGIRDAHPGEDIVAVGVSLGGIILMQYLHRTGDSCPLKAVMTASSAWNCTVTNKIMETDFINSLYLRYLASKLKKIVFENAKLATKERLDQLPCSVEELLQCKYISDFDKKLTVPMFGYSSLEEYYQDSSTHNRVHRIKRPLLIITAADDPFVPYKTLPLSPIESNPMTAIAITPRGGHIGFMQGLLPTGPSWLDCVCRQFLRAAQHLTKED